jgi:hypothetical protein
MNQRHDPVEFDRPVTIAGGFPHTAAEAPVARRPAPVAPNAGIAIESPSTTLTSSTTVGIQPRIIEWEP